MQMSEGVISMLGNSSGNSKARTYSVIEVGSTTLQNKVISSSLDNYLQRAYSMGGISKLYLRGKLILGVELSDGKIYYYRGNSLFALINIILGIPLILFFGLGLFIIWQGVAEMGNVKVGDELKRRGGVAVKL